MEIDIELLDHQLAFMQSEKPMTILLAGRASGKSFIAGIKIATLLVQGYSVIFIAQNYRMVKKVMVVAIEDALKLIKQPYEKNIGDMTITVGKAVAHGFSAESAESIRGLTNIKALFIDEAALCSKDTLDIASACLRGQGAPLIYLISTPRGRGNYLNTLVNDTDNEVIRATTYDNTFIDESFVKLLEKQYDDDFAKQELMGEILNSDAPNQMIPTLSIKTGTHDAVTNEKIVIAVDPSRFGQDETVLYVRKGYNIVDCEAMGKTNTDDIVHLVEKYERKYGRDNINAINFDGTGGYASGSVDQLSKTRKNVHEYNFGSSSPNDNCANYRTYLYQLAIEYFDRGGTIGEDQQLFDELVAQEYIINNSGKKALVPKINIKQKLGHSPDRSDSFVLTLVTNGDMFTENKEAIRVNDIVFKARINRITKATQWKND
jgi:hypothetical protein